MILRQILAHWLFLASLIRFIAVDLRVVEETLHYFFVQCKHMLVRLKNTALDLRMLVNK